MAKFSDITQTIGRTPVVRLSKLVRPDVNLYVKLESFNPMASVKDRLAIAVIEEAERTGKLKPGQTVIEATSGNTGIGLAMVCAQRGYPLVIVMAESFSVERHKLMRFLGAKVVLTPAAERGSGMLAKAVELAKAHGWFLTRQFENEANADIHSRTTAREILDDFAGERLDWWVTGFGTGGTLRGVARVLRAERPTTKIAVAEPDNSPLLGSGITQQVNPDGTYPGAHPAFRPHLMQGWSPDFISKLTADAIAAGHVDRILPINGRKALDTTRDLATKEGIFAGITSGAALSGAIDICNASLPGTTVLCMIPDTGERYLSTPLFADMPADMDAEETDISRSTPNYRFDVRPAPAPAKPAAAEPEIPVKADAAAFVEKALGSAEEPVVMFALEWCEFCWAARKLFTRAGVKYRSVDLDSFEYQKDDRGGDIRRALYAKTGMKTIPQIFIGGKLVGGSTDLLEAWKQGKAQDMLKEKSVAFTAPAPGFDPYSLLPTWLQAR
ncbi:MAG: pyridoxal-phosphate dependent enzyme [Alphaproteobacteria bacterium]|nr:pyridoxal-phosphate dependent enzyme [Alphaproteobacteria bacterium]